MSRGGRGRRQRRRGATDWRSLEGIRPPTSPAIERPLADTKHPLELASASCVRSTIQGAQEYVCHGQEVSPAHEENGWRKGSLAATLAGTAEAFANEADRFEFLGKSAGLSDVPSCVQDTSAERALRRSSLLGKIAIEPLEKLDETAVSEDLGDHRVTPWGKPKRGSEPKEMG